MAAVKLWNLRPIIIASIIGTPTAGCILMALNYYRSGEKKTAILTLSAGIAIAAMDLVAPFLLPSILAGLLAVAALIAAIYFAVKIHRPFLQEQVSAGAQRASIWSGIGVGAALWVVYTLVAFISFGGLPTAGRFTTLAVGAKDDVYYSQDVTEKEAKALGEALKSVGLFQDRGAAVFLSKHKQGAIVSFVVQDGIWDDQNKVSLFEQITRAVAPSVGGTPIKMQLQNQHRVVKKELTIK